MESLKRLVRSIKYRSKYPLKKKSLYNILLEKYILPEFKSKAINFAYLHGVKQGIIFRIPKNFDFIDIDVDLKKKDIYYSISHKWGFSKDNIPSLKWMKTALFYYLNQFLETRVIIEKILDSENVNEIKKIKSKIQKKVDGLIKILKTSSERKQKKEKTDILKFLLDNYNFLKKKNTIKIDKNNKICNINHKFLYNIAKKKGFYLPGRKKITKAQLKDIIELEKYCPKNGRKIKKNKCTKEELFLFCYRLQKSTGYNFWFSHKNIPSAKYMANFLYQIEPEEIFNKRYIDYSNFNSVLISIVLNKMREKYNDINLMMFFFCSDIDISPFEVVETEGLKEKGIYFYNNSISLKNLINKFIINNLN